eukprot:m51a1_g9355 hypothetical protein (240) ;mRNA; r:134287-135506
MDTEVQQTRIPLHVASTLDDLVFAAFQGPVLSLSSRVLLHSRTFTALLLVRARWRCDRGLSRADVAGALMQARCCSSASLETRQCDVCGPLLEITPSAAQERVLQSRVPKGVEFSMLALVVDLAPGVSVVSQRFSVSMMAVGMALSVRLCSVTYSSEEQQIIASSLVHVLRAKVPGFVLHKTGLIANIGVIVIGCSTASGLVEAWESDYLYITNAIRNPLNRNLLEGVIQPLAHVTNLR